MARRHPIAAAAVIATAAMIAILVPAPLRAQAEQESVVSGNCQYSDQVARFRDETTLILCDTVTVSRDATSAPLDFSQRSWGSMARFTGDMAGDKMTVSRIALRDGGSLAATGTCEILHRYDGQLSAVSCLARAASGWIAASFVPSHL